MTDVTRALATQTALELAQEFIRSVEAKDLDAVAGTLAVDAQQLFMHSLRSTTPQGAADVIAGRGRGICVAYVKGKKEILTYTSALFDKFTPLIWRDHEWTVSPSGDEVFFRANGNMVHARTGRPYRNSYLIRFDIEDGQIVRIAEFGDAFLYASLRVLPNGTEVRALLRAIGRMIVPTRSRGRSGMTGGDRR